MMAMVLWIARIPPIARMTQFAKAELIRDAAQAKAAITGVNAPPFAGAAEETQAATAVVPAAPQPAPPTQQ